MEPLKAYISPRHETEGLKHSEQQPAQAEGMSSVLLLLPQTLLPRLALGSAPLATVATICKPAKENYLASNIQSRSLCL